jgi:hypothetical protein
VQGSAGHRLVAYTKAVLHGPVAPGRHASSDLARQMTRGFTAAKLQSPHTHVRHAEPGLDRREGRPGLQQFDRNLVG